MRYLISFIILTHIHSCASKKHEIVKDENGNIFLKCELKKGVRHGTCYQYYPNGAIWVVSSWIAGFQDGETIEYFENGSIHSTTMFQDGKQHGKRVEYSENEGIKNTSMWKDGKQDGDCYEYFENGSEKVWSYFINGFRMQDEFYDEEGRLQKRYNYIVVNKKTKLNGVVIYDVDNISNNPYGINIQESLHAKIFADKDTIDYGSFVEYNVRWMCSDDHYLAAIAGNFDHNFNLIDDYSVKRLDLDNKNRFYPSNLESDTLRVIFYFEKIEDGKKQGFETFLEKVFTVIEK